MSNPIFPAEKESHERSFDMEFKQFQQLG